MVWQTRRRPLRKVSGPGGFGLSPGRTGLQNFYPDCHIIAGPSLAKDMAFKKRASADI